MAGGARGLCVIVLFVSVGFGVTDGAGAWRRRPAAGVGAKEVHSIFGFVRFTIIVFFVFCSVPSILKLSFGQGFRAENRLFAEAGAFSGVLLCGEGAWVRGKG